MINVWLIKQIKNIIINTKYNFKLDLMHIRAKLLKPSIKEKSYLKAIMPASSSSSSSLSNIRTIDSFENSEILNDFAIDVTHIEKVVQDTDLIMIEKK